MNERPILFSGPMVRAILEGRKTQTRRVVKPQPNEDWHLLFGVRGPAIGPDDMRQKIIECPYGASGDRLWVRETWKCEEQESGVDGVRYAADGAFRPIENTPEAAALWCQAKREGDKWRPSIFMPRWASRLALEIVAVRVEQVQDITPVGALAEGIAVEKELSARAQFSELWNSINAERGFGWAVNPWVWVVEFKRI